MMPKFSDPVRDPLGVLLLCSLLIVTNLGPLMSGAAQAVHTFFLLAACGAAGIYYAVSYFTFRVEIFGEEIHHRNKLGRRKIYKFEEITRFEKDWRKRNIGKDLDVLRLFVDGERVFTVHSGMTNYDHFQHQIKRDLPHKIMEGKLCNH